MRVPHGVNTWGRTMVAYSPVAIAQEKPLERETPCTKHQPFYHTRVGVALRTPRKEPDMAGMRDYSDAEVELVRKSFSGRYALRDRCYFEMSLQMGLRVSEMLSLTVAQVYQYGTVAEEVSIDRKHIKGGKAGKASGRTIPLFPATHPHILAWLERLAAILKVHGPKAIDPTTPLFLSRVHNKDGSPRAIARETAWRIIKGIARENELSGKVGTHSTRKTVAHKVYTWSNDIRVVQRILGHKSLQSTEAYLKSLTDCEVWTAFRTAAA